MSVSSSRSGFFRRSQLFYIVIGVTSVLLLIVSGLAYYQSKNSGQAYLYVEKTLAIDNALERVLSTYKDMETGSRGYLISQRIEYLAPYEAGVGRIDREMAELENYIAGNAVQEDFLKQASGAIEDKRNVMARLVQLAQNGEWEAARALFLTGQGKDAMDVMRDFFGKMQAHEKELLKNRQARKAREAANIDRVILATLALNGLVVVLLIWMVRRVGRLQKIVTVCAWSKTIEYEGEWLSFEEYLRRRHRVEISHGISEEALAKLQDDIKATGLAK